MYRLLSIHPFETCRLNPFRGTADNAVEAVNVNKMLTESVYTETLMWRYPPVMHSEMCQNTLLLLLSMKTHKNITDTAHYTTSHVRLLWDVPENASISEKVQQLLNKCSRSVSSQTCHLLLLLPSVWESLCLMSCRDCLDLCCQCY